MDGKKTYILAILGGFAVFASAMKWVPPEYQEQVSNFVNLVLLGGLATLRHGIRNEAESLYLAQLADDEEE